MKMVINLLLGTGMAAFAEAMALGEGLGLSSKLLFDSLLGTPAVAPFLAAKRDKIDNRNYEAEFPLRWMQKDMHLATVSAYEAGVAMPLTNVTKEMYRLAMRDGHATEDFSAIYEFVAGEGDPRPANQPRTARSQYAPRKSPNYRRFSAEQTGNRNVHELETRE